LNVTKKGLLRDIEKAPEFDQSRALKKSYEEEYGVFGGAPFGALIGDYEFGKHPEDMACWMEFRILRHRPMRRSLALLS